MILAMRRLILVVILALLLLVWGSCAVVARHVADEAAAAPWPLQLGGLREVPARYPKRSASPAALALGPLEARLGIRFDRNDKRPVTKEERAFSLVKESLANWISAQVVSAHDAITPPPPELARFLDEHQADIDAIRDHVLANEKQIEWVSDLSQLTEAPLPNLLAHMAVTRCLAAAALRSGDWQYLHAVWILSRALWQRPEPISLLIAIATTRFVFASACRFSSPAPEWFGEIARVDYVRAMAAAQQAEAWTVFVQLSNDPFAREGAAQRRIGFPFRPIAKFWAADLAKRERAIVMHFAPMRECAIDGATFDKRTLDALPKFAIHARIALPNWGSMWQRLARFRAEVELAERVVALKARKWPPLAPDLSTSQCSDGTWKYADGELHFSREIPARGSAFPLRYSAPAGVITPSRNSPRST